MQYDNPQVDTSVNISPEHPLKEFAQLVIGVGVVCFIIAIVLSWLAESLVKYVPFSYEQSMISHLDFLDADTVSRSSQLQALADRLAKHMDLPDEIELRLYYQKTDTVNAFATLGGNIVFFEGLVEKLESEDELAAVMAHEIAHIKLRHPIAAMGKGVSLSAFAGFVGGFSGSSAGQWLFNSSAQVTFMQYSRKQELAADSLAAQALNTEYGHIQGAKELFKRFKDLEAKSIASKITIEALRSHPYSSDRWAAIFEQAKNRNWQTIGELTPLELLSQQI